MEWTFGQVEQVLAHVHNIREDRRSAFANRLKNYQKAGFPQGINTGRGRAASYSVGHVLLLALALELNQLGLTPERAKAVIEDDMHTVAMAYSHAASTGAPKGDFPAPMFIYLDPSGLSDLMIDHGEDRAIRSFFYAGLGQSKESLTDWSTGGLKRMSLVSVSSLLWDVASYSSLALKRDPDDFYEQVKIWASPFIHNEPYYGRD